MPSDISFKSEFEFDLEGLNIFENVEAGLVNRAIDAGIRPASSLIADELSIRMPDGNAPKADGKPGSSKRQSKSYKTKFGTIPLRTKAAYAIRKLKVAVFGIVGVRHPDGNEIYPLLTGHKFFRWDPKKQPTGLMVKESEDFLRMTFEAKKSEAADMVLRKAGEVIQKEMGT